MIMTKFVIKSGKHQVKEEFCVLPSNFILLSLLVFPLIHIDLSINATSRLAALARSFANFFFPYRHFWSLPRHTVNFLTPLISLHICHIIGIMQPNIFSIIFGNLINTECCVSDSWCTIAALPSVSMIESATSYC
jgi:hypothetical protein